MNIRKTTRVAPAAPTGERTQLTKGTLSIVGDKGIRTSFAKPKTTNVTGITAGTKKVVREDSDNARKNDKKNVNRGYNAKNVMKMKTKMLMLDTKVIADRIDNNKDVHSAYFVGKWPEAMDVDSPSAHQNLKDWLAYGRDIVGKDFGYVWDFERLENGQPHINVPTALTDREAHLLSVKWMKVTGNTDAGSMKEFAHFRMSTSFEEATLRGAQLVERMLNYISAIGESETAIRKAAQYWNPKGWTESGSGAMWGHSRNIKEAKEITLEISNARQRVAVDLYMTERLNIESKMIMWQYSDGTVSEAYDQAAFSRDRHGGSTRTLRVTPDIVNDLRAIIAHFA